MSRQARDWAWAQTQVTGNRKVVLLYAAERADDHGHCWPKLNTVASACGLDPHTVSTHLRDLERENGLLRRERQRRADGSFTGRVLIWLAMPSGLNGPVDPPAGSVHVANPGPSSGLSRPAQGPNGAGAVTTAVTEPSSEPPPPPPQSLVDAGEGEEEIPSEEKTAGVRA